MAHCVADTWRRIIAAVGGVFPFGGGGAMLGVTLVVSGFILVRTDLLHPYCFDEAWVAVSLDKMDILAELLFEVGEVLDCVVDGVVEVGDTVF